MSRILALAFAPLFLFVPYPAAAVVLLVVNSSTLSFKSKVASFSPDLESSGISGYVALGNPADACSTLESPETSSSSPFLLAMMGNCSSEAKVRNGQDAGFSAVIIYNNESGSSLPSMTGSSEGITIYAVSITKAAGETLAQYADNTNVTVSILPSYEDAVWSAIVFTLIFVLAIAAGLFTWYIVKRDRNRRRRRFKGPIVISVRIVEAMPTTIYKVAGNQKAIQESCTICQEDYIPGEKLRILPCSHRFHCTCVDAWLTLWRAVCPNCKRDARYEFPDLEASERTPLLNFLASSSESTPIQIPPAPSDIYSGTPSFSKGASSSRISQPRVPDSFRHHASMESSLEAFRASPYFTPPSMSYNPSPLAYGCSPAMGSASPHSGGSSRDLDSRSFLNPRRVGSSSPAVGSFSSLSCGSQNTYLNPGKAKNSSTT